MSTKMIESYFFRTTFRLVIIGTVWCLFSNFEIKQPKNVFWNILVAHVNDFSMSRDIEDQKY